MESDLSKPVSDWLTSMGYTVYVEVPMPHSASHIDIVGRKDHETICVELKSSLSKGVIHQAFRCQLLTFKVYAVVARTPRNLDRAKERGIGVILVKEGLNILLEPTVTKYSDTLHEPSIARLHNYLDHMEPGGIGGKPNLKGVGPAKDCGRRVTEYLTANPNAKWKDIYANVSNHYASANSMRSAMDRWCHIRN
jgi:hypothetical protein